MSILDAFYSLGSKINKATGNAASSETDEGVSSDKFPELKLDMDNDELVKLTENWKKKWDESEVKTEWLAKIEDNVNYWKGDQFDQPKAAKDRPLMDNVIFESLETYLPQVTRRNPDPMVTLSRKEEQSKENISYASNLQKELGELADETVLRLKLKKAARHWAVYLVGVVKMGWDLDRDIPISKVIKPTKIILDPDGVNDEDGYSGEYVGEYRKMQAGTLIDTIEAIGGEEEAVKDIKDAVKENLGTEVIFIEWWTAQYTCWTLKNKLLLKKKNPHWNYDTEKEAPYTEDGMPSTNEDGSLKMEKVAGFNHFPTPKIPYLFLTVFNLGDSPVDSTSLIGQNLASQDLVNKRLRQIDKNADSMNGGMVVSLERAGMTIQEAKGVSNALRNGGTVAIPAGSVSEAIQRMSAPSLPNDVYLQLTDTRARMRDIFGTRGSSPAGLQAERTVRGKLQNQLLDTDRIGGGFSEYLEQLADSIYNWNVQLLYVYDENYQKADKPKVIVSVKEGSLLPKDSLTLANQAIELAGQNRMSLVDLYKALDYPNPEEMAANVWLEAHAPDVLLSNDERVKAVLDAEKENKSNEEDKPVSKSISFKDLPPEGQAQLALQAGIQLNPEGIAVYKEAQAKKDVVKNIVTELGRKAINDAGNK